MTTFEILVKCGYSPEEASKKSGMPIPKEYTTANLNEQRYSSIPDLDMDWFRRKHAGGTYSEIASGSENGCCTTRAGTYRKLVLGRYKKHPCKR